MIMTYGLGSQQGDGLKSQSDRIGRFLTFFLIISLAVSSIYPTVLPEFVGCTVQARGFSLDHHYRTSVNVNIFNDAMAAAACVCLLNH